MIKIRIHSDRTHFRMDVRGHAEYAPKGEDIVCAAVSAITHTMCVYTMESIHTGDHVVLKDENGWIYLECDTDEYALEALKAMTQGLSQIQENYPDNVTIEHD